MGTGDGPGDRYGSGMVTAGDLVVGSDVVDDDAMWKPGYIGPPPTSSPAADPVTATPVELPGDPAHRTGRWRRRAVVGIVVIVAVGLALVVVDPFTADAPTADAPAATPVIGAPDRSVFDGPEDRRLPLVATELWSVEVGDVGRHWVEVVGRELVVVAVGSSSPGTTLRAFDAIAGAQRWTRELPGDPVEVAVVGAVDDVLVVEQPGESGPAVSGFDMATGESRWSADVGPNAGHVGLQGTRFVARLPSPPDTSVVLLDAASGREVGTLVSDPAADGRPGGWFTDRRGTWYASVDGEVVSADLASGSTEATTVGAVDTGPVAPVVVGDRLVAVEADGSLVLVGPDGRRSSAGSSDVPAPVRSLTPVSGSNFVVTAPGSIAGVAVEGDAFIVEWRRDGGAEVGYHPVQGGTLLQVATRGGAAMQLVDGVSGTTVEQLVMVPGALQALEVAGDGFVVLRTATLGTRVAGVDLDGTERWSILGPEPVLLGDRLVVRATSTPSGAPNEAGDVRSTLRLVAYGDAV